MVFEMETIKGIGLVGGNRRGVSSPKIKKQIIAYESIAIDCWVHPQNLWVSSGSGKLPSV
jgi:hypothetical protein